MSWLCYKKNKPILSNYRNDKMAHEIWVRKTLSMYVIIVFVVLSVCCYGLRGASDALNICVV